MGTTAQFDNTKLKASLPSKKSKLLINEHQDLYPNFARLAAVALGIPVTNADCEGVFST